MAGKLANDLLIKRMSKHGYHLCQYKPGLWKHVWRPFTFTLVVDDFGIKFLGDASGQTRVHAATYQNHPKRDH